jgi:integrase
MPGLTEPLRKKIEANRSLKKLRERMIEREGKSESTLARYLNGVFSFAEFMKCKDPDRALLQFKNSEDPTELLDQYIDFLRKTKQLRAINLKAHFFGVKKWLTTNRVNNIDYDYISRPKIFSVRVQDRIARKSELRIILTNKVTLRDRTLFLCSAASGLRVGTIRTLRFRDYKAVEELGMLTVEAVEEVQGLQRAGTNLPCLLRQIEGRKLGNSNGAGYFTFITPEARKTLEEYLATREDLKAEDPLFAGESKTNGKALSPWVHNVSRQWRRLVRKANLERKISNHSWTELHLHTLRKFFQTNCKLAGCRADFVDFWMGHHPVRQDEYLNDSYFRPELSSHLAEYRKAVEALTVFDLSAETNRKMNEQIETLKGEVESLKSLLIGPVAPRGFRNVEELASIITSQKHMIEELRKYDLVTTVEGKTIKQKQGYGHDWHK